ncbi:hypothetical protein Lal_00034613 [Lupinus albus]|uniref:Putative non-specific serine/threonine protein kinase n=1 Tax=Lupinus albus TaxID=3870 RepID=A0A6A4QTR5_LUPAL|nr:putative non-specific serine/threonine protein kinase [Lupinus albus]KAF1896912.1 hypothetical protein Lal_00034613 [Lupinus albus]
MNFLHSNLIFSLFLLTFHTFSVLSHLFSPTDNYLINCGSTVPTTTLHDNRHFSGDLPSKQSSPPLFSSPSSSAVSLQNDNNLLPDLPSIYHTARVFTRPAKYSFPIKATGTHIVRLHFHAFNSSIYDLGRSQFHVLVNGYVVLSNFSSESGNPRIIEYLIWVDAEKLVIVFVPVKDSNFAFVNAIEVISAPEDLVPDIAQYLNVSSGNVEKFDGLSKQAIEVVYRVNVGGPKVTPFNDSLWRTWIPDDEFFRSSGVVGSEKLYFGGRIKYQAGGASREIAPDNVYNSARLIRSTNGSVPNLNLTWMFPVVEGYKHLVRLHFCDIASISLGLLYFNVYVNGYLAYEELDLSYITNSLASPFYADFVVDGNRSGPLSVSIGPSKNSIPRAIDGILNGVEVMKLSNSHGSLDGEVCADFALKSFSRGNTGVLLTYVAAICIVLSLFIVIRRRVIGCRESVTWSRLPVNLSDDNVKT